MTWSVLADIFFDMMREAKISFELILCYDQRIREKVKDILNIVFDDIYSNSE